MHLLLIFLVAVLLPVSAAEAAFPGNNGRIAYSFGSPNEFERGFIYALNPDGTQKAPLTDGSDYTSGTQGISWSPDGGRVVYDDGCCSIYRVDVGDPTATEIVFSGYDELAPAWSADGSKIVFQSDRGDCGPSACDFELWTSNPDGSGQTQLTDNTAFDGSPASSPDGHKIAFFSDRGPIGIWVMNADGTGAAFVAAGSNPNWSPDGSKLAFNQLVASNSEIFTMSATGSGQTQLTSDPASDSDPAWSPDGSKIVWVHGNRLYSMDADGSDQAQIGTPSFGEEAQTAPDWQPIPINGYPRPKGATPMYLSLVPAYAACTAPNRQHGAPLVVNSCNPPAQTSAVATVGTLDANGNPAKSVGFADLRVKVGNPATPTDEANVNLHVRISDVRKPDLSDYTGELQARPLLRITDKLNTPHPGGPGAATTQDVPFPFTVPCAVTGDATIGSLCEVVTSADAVLPGTVSEERRSNWQLQRFDVYDDSATLFATQGIFVP